MKSTTEKRPAKNKPEKYNPTERINEKIL